LSDILYNSVNHEIKKIQAKKYNLRTDSQKKYNLRTDNVNQRKSVISGF